MKRVPLLSSPRLGSLTASYKSIRAQCEGCLRGSGSSAFRPAFARLIATSDLTAAHLAPPAFLCPRLDHAVTTGRKYTASARPAQAAEAAVAEAQPPFSEEERLRIAYRATKQALRSGSPLDLLYGLLSGAKASAFIGAHSPAQVAQICRVLDFEVLAAPYKGAHDGVTRLHRIASVMKHANEFRAQLRDGAEIVRRMMQHWRKARGIRFTVQEYNSLLAGANECGDSETAQALFRDMEADEVRPDIVSYNHYFEVHCYNHEPPRGNDVSKFPRANSTINRTQREFGLPGVFLSTEQRMKAVVDRPIEGSSGSPMYGIIEERVRKNDQIMEVFREMIGRGVAPNTDTLCFLALSFARSGNLDGVKKMLQDVWKIDVDKILDEGANELADHDTPKESPIYPNHHLLFALVHAFQRDQHPSVPLNLVQHVARRYELSIDGHTWRELLRAALMYDKSHGVDASAPSDGQSDPVHPSAIDFIWTTMCSTPHHVQLDFTMYRMLLTSLYLRGQPLRVYEELQQAKRLVDQKMFAAINADSQAKRRMSPRARSRHGPERASSGQRTTTDMALTACLHERRYMTQWLLLLLDPKSWPTGTAFIPKPFFTVEFVPAVLEQFGFFQPPQGVGYDTENGRVEFETAWRFWLPKSRFQVVVDETSGKRLAQLTKAGYYRNRPIETMKKEHS